MNNAFYNTLVLLLCSCLIAGCTTTPVAPDVTNPPHRVPQPKITNSERPVIAFVLGGGAARGFAHVGVLKALEENGIEADIVVGTSAGSVVGSLYAGGIRGDELVEAAMNLNLSQLTDWMFPNRGVLRGELLQSYVNNLLDNRPIEKLDIPFIAAVTDLESGELVILNAGDTGMAVRASSAIPGLVQPVSINGREYVDGGLVSQVPVRIARRYGADLVIAVDVSRTPLPRPELGSTVALLRQSVIIMSNRIAETELEEADIVIRPAVGMINVGEFDSRDVAVLAGEQAALAAIPEIKRRLAELAQQ